jgi:CubicO group peptidase (beta-lactamase class C family)
VSSPRARGYVIGRGAVTAVTDRDWVSLGASNVFSTAADMSRFVGALLAGGAGQQGSILRAATLTTMYEPHYLPDPRLPGMGLGFFRVDDGGIRAVEHQGVLPGFDSYLLMAPEDGVGIVALTNGSKGAFTWLPIEFRRLLHDLSGLPEQGPRSNTPHQPEIWDELCGRYRLPSGSDLRGRAGVGGGVEVFVRGGRLMLRVLTPFPALYRGLPLRPDDPEDPYVFRLDLSRLGMTAVRVVFGREPGNGTKVLRTHLGSEPMSLYERPPRAWWRLMSR